MLKFFNVPTWDWIYSIYENIDSCGNSLKTLCDDYLEEVKEELWPSKEAVLKNLKKYMGEFISGKRGNNITFKYRALLLKEERHIKDAFDLGFSELEKVMREKRDIKTAHYQDFMDQLKKLCTLRKQNIFNTDNEIIDSFDFDFSKIDQPEFTQKIFLRLNAGVSFKIDHTKEQKDFIDKYFRTHEKEKVLDIAFLLNRVPAKTMYRRLEIRDRTSVIPGVAKRRPGISEIPVFRAVKTARKPE